MAKFEIGGEALTVAPMNFRALRAHRTVFRPAVLRVQEVHAAWALDRSNDKLADAVLEAIEAAYGARLEVIAAHQGTNVDGLMSKVRGLQELRGLTAPFAEWMNESGFETESPQASPPTQTAEGLAADQPA